MQAGKWMVCALLFLCATRPVHAQSSMLDSLVTTDSLQYLVQTLAADSMQGRLAGSEEANQAARFIAATFSKAGAAPLHGHNDYLLPFQVFVKENAATTYNVVAVLPGRSRPGELILFTAHYDHVGTPSGHHFYRPPEKGGPEKNDTIYNGANDNASGVSAIISLARYFGRLNNNERTIIFIAFSGEEMGLLGSRFMANVIRADSIKAMINMDMIGRRAFKRDTRPYITGHWLSNLQQILNDQLAADTVFGKQYFKKDPFSKFNLFARSDNFWFAKKGVPAHTILTSSPEDKYYHSLNDEPPFIDYPLLAKVIKAIALGSSPLINGSATPNRIDPARIVTPNFR
jgi:Zn-dependent M28 family amino/carboxypeptidase